MVCKVCFDDVVSERTEMEILIFGLETRPGGVEVRRPPLGGKNEGSIPVVLGFFLRSV